MTEVLYKYHLTIHHPNRKRHVDYKDFQYMQMYLWMKHHIIIDDHVYEEGKYGGKHIHCIARTVQQLRFQDMSKFAGYRLFWKCIRNDRYMNHIKDYHKKEDLKEQFGSSLIDDRRAK